MPEETQIYTGFPRKGDNVVRIGDVVSLNWKNMDLSNVNIIFYKGEERIPVTNKEIPDGQNSFNIFIDNSFFTEEYKKCFVRIEMKENPLIFQETPKFNVLRNDDRSA